ncbi:glycoside hydrolase family 2 TIM barrel-domain containing protein [Pelagicoccus sp. SDUM812003]|uniref:glycoside hydrolase family 2 TIM barrel-domain containing protein n=1 Tax=Pelagicoccus sp. SDUM812003 TaxID=3041267 RepID=UPI00281074F8|nr:glycoside hydrolase family 2 TIM barrel-domain containing protein [Pelagicoccus sp. SDUM812003]MDQ8205035.1 glycoside hydrolase family 2 TIM barrel-domain containing protein [Pelagicoccus sp. SDUM812003]
MTKTRRSLFRASLAGCFVSILATLSRAAFPSAEPDPINFGWRFAEGENAKAMQPGFDDSTWEAVDLPHDWAIHKNFDPEGDPNTAKLEWKGEGWYRKTFKLPADARGKRLQFLFDGVMANPTVYLNGEAVGSWIYGYNSFHIDATDAANFGGENVLAVHVDTQAHHSRWYPGAGIYRKVSMRLVDPVHIPYWGVAVTTPRVEGDEASVQVDVELANETGKAQSAEVVVEILDPLGEVVRAETRAVEVPVAGIKATLQFELDAVKRWDVEHPYLYTAKTAILADAGMSDNLDTNFGIRTYEWTADDGFHLNGRRVDLQGVNEHHTHGMLGAAFFPRAVERKFEILRDMGVNALRTSHNPEAPEVLELCDRLGIVVFNELYDKWDRTGGVDVDTATFVNEYAEREVRNFVRRDRNHPSVMLWSVANEDGAVLTNRDGKSAEHVAKMVSYFEKYDNTRPTTMGCHVASGARREWGIFEALDSSGWNYSQRYMNFRKNYPEKPIIYSETASAFGTRGHYELDLPESKIDFGDDGFQNGFILTAAPWGDIPEHEFERMRKHRFLNGDFVWTGFDYLGEPTPARGVNSPPELKLEARSSYFGIVDLAGLPKDTFYLYRSQWNKAERTVRLSPHWNWSEGDQVPAIIYTDGDEAELFLNGRSIGRKSKVDPDQMQTANIAYQKTSYASSSQVVQDQGGNVLTDNTTDKAFDGNPNTRWAAADGTTPQFLKVDLGEERSFKQIRIQWESAAEIYDYAVLISSDDENWTPVGGEESRIGELTTIEFDWVDARFVKLEVNEIEGNRWASVRELEVLDKETANRNPYYDVVDAYRIRFFDIPYEPGELKVVAYRDGQRIGEDVVQTAGPPATLELTPDRRVMKADGMDLCYVAIKLLDDEGRLCPWAMDELSFETEGAATFMGVANGNSIGFDALTDETHPLFYGQAVAVLRSKPGEAGRATLTVKAEGYPEAKAELLFAE